MNEMVETNKLIKTVKGTYKKLTNVKNQSLRNPPNPQKTATKAAKTVKCIDNKIKHDKNDGKTHKRNQIQLTLRKTKPIKMTPQLKSRLVT